jgi:predicted phage terminase large subunit-like protein
MISRKEYLKRIEEILELIHSTEPFKDTSKKARKERLSKAENDVIYFFRTYLPHYFSTEFADFHYELIMLLETREVPVVVALPRGFGKTTICTFGYVLHQVLFKKRHYIILISETFDQAQDFILPLRLELEHNERIKQDFGEIKKGKWADDEIVANNVKVKALGAGQKIRGRKFRQYRPDLIIVDDIENDKTARNDKITNKKYRWILEAVYPALGKNASLFVIGNVFSKRSVISRLLEHPEWKKIKYSAIKKDGTPLWAAEFPIERLERIKKIIGTQAFNKEYMNEPEDEEGNFQRRWIRYFDEEQIRDKVLRIYAACDPSLGSGEVHDYKAVVVIGIDDVGIIYVLDAWIRKASIDAMLDVCYDKYFEYRYLVLALETQAFQEILLREFDKKAKEKKLHLPIRGIKHHISKVSRVLRLSPYIERGIIRFRKGNQDIDLLIDQIVNFPSDTLGDDGPDALEMAVSIAEGLVDYREVSEKMRTVKKREIYTHLRRY